MSLRFIKGDLTEMDSDAIVNAANCYLQPGSGVCGAIFNKAGFTELMEACNQIGHINIGECCMTDGFHLKSRYIIHTVGPIYIDGKHHEDTILRKAYWNSLNMAFEHGLQSISFPLISTGVFGYPKEEAISIAIQTINDFLKVKNMTVNLVALDNMTYKMMKNSCID